MSAIVVARGVSFEFSNGRELFKNLDVSLEPTLTGLVGANGVGKTYLAKLLAGEIEPTAGVVRRNGSVTLFPQREAPPSVTVAEYLATDYEWSLLGERLLKNVDPHAPCTTLSGGQWMRVRLARALGDDYLILDEPTNDLDRDGRAAVAQFLCGRTGGALLISHDRNCLPLCTEILEFSNRGLTKFGGNWSAYLEAKHRERDRLSTALEVAKRERERAFADRVEQMTRQERRNRRGSQSALRGGAPKILLGARKRRAQVSTGKLATATTEHARAAVATARAALEELKVDPVMYASMSGVEVPSQKLIAAATAFNIRFDDWIYRNDLEFAWRGNVRVAVKGTNGSGKSTLLKALAGKQFTTRGELRRGDLVTFCLDQRCSTLDDTKNVLDNVREVASSSDTEIRNELARFLFAKDAVFLPVRDLSGGERMRAALARGLLSTRQPELLLLDEPTNNLDLDNVEFLERIVREFRGALVIISHDDTFLENCGVAHELILPE